MDTTRRAFIGAGIAVAVVGTAAAALSTPAVRVPAAREQVPWWWRGAPDDPVLAMMLGLQSAAAHRPEGAA